MGKFLLVCLLLACPVLAVAHPGKTDRLGGHKCWKDCGEWDLDYGEYHLHDKDYRPLRVRTKEDFGLPSPVNGASEERAAGTSDVVSGTIPLRKEKPQVKERNETPDKYAVRPQEEIFFPYDPYLLMLIAFLLLLLLALMLAARRGRNKKG